MSLSVQTPLLPAPDTSPINHQYLYEAKGIQFQVLASKPESRIMYGG